MNNNQTAINEDKGKGNVRTHKELYSKNPDYDPMLNKKLCLLYQGGFAIQKQAGLFLDRLPGLESAKSYQNRLKSISYIPYLSEFTTQFGASLFSEELEIKPGLGKSLEEDFYCRFVDDCDLSGQSLHQFMHNELESSLHQLSVYVGIDFPQQDPDITPANRYQEKLMGLDQGYLYTIPYDNVIDWKKDANGKFIWLKIWEECFTDDDPLVLAQHFFQFKFWQIKNGRGSWTVWQTPLMPLNKKYDDKTKYTLKSQLSGSTSFPEIPIFDLTIPKGYHVGQQIGSICQEHYQRRSFMVSNANKTCVAVGVVTLGPEIGAPGETVPVDIPLKDTPRSLRKDLEEEGWTVLRKTETWADTLDIKEADGKSHKFIAEDLKHLVEAMMQTLRQMNMSAKANQHAQGRSAASKQIDQHGTSMLLSVYERIVKDFVKKVLKCLSSGRKEKYDWVVEGLSTSEPIEQRTDLVDEVKNLGIDIWKLPNIFKNKYLSRISNELLNGDMSDPEKMQLQQEIEKDVTAGKWEPIDPDINGGNDPADPVNNDDMGAPLEVGENGNKQLPEGGHLQTGNHQEAADIYNQLLEDYKPSDIQWVKQFSWKLVEVPTSSIDFSKQDTWKASKPGKEGQEKVDMFADKMKEEGFTKPVILVNTPHNDQKMQLIDGRHRSLAAVKAGIPVLAWVADVGSVDDGTPWMQLHGKQIGSNNSSGG